MRICTNWLITLSASITWIGSMGEARMWVRRRHMIRKRALKRGSLTINDVYN